MIEKRGSCVVKATLCEYNLKIDPYIFKLPLLFQVYRRKIKKHVYKFRRQMADIWHQTQVQDIVNPWNKFFLRNESIFCFQ